MWWTCAAALRGPRCRGRSIRHPQRVLPDGRRVRLRPAGPPHHRQQHHDSSGGPAPGRRPLLHGRRRPAARPQRTVTPGALSISQILAWWDAGTRLLHGVHDAHVRRAPSTAATADQAAADSGGTWNDIDIGHSVYTFKTALPAGFDQTKTTRSAIYATRNTTDIVGKNYYANVEYDFRPDGAHGDGRPGTRRSTETATTCHNPLVGARRLAPGREALRACATHPQTIDPDTGHTVDFR